MTDIKPVADPMKNLQECIGRYGVQCSETKELAPSIELVNAFANLQSALLQAREEGRREGMREAEKYLCEAIVATQGDRDGYLVCDVADLLRLFNERKAIARAAEGK